MRSKICKQRLFCQIPFNCSAFSEKHAHENLVENHFSNINFGVEASVGAPENALPAL